MPYLNALASVGHELQREAVRAVSEGRAKDVRAVIKYRKKRAAKTKRKSAPVQQERHPNDRLEQRHKFPEHIPASAYGGMFQPVWPLSKSIKQWRTLL